MADLLFTITTHRKPPRVLKWQHLYTLNHRIRVRASPSCCRICVADKKDGCAKALKVAEAFQRHADGNLVHSAGP